MSTDCTDSQLVNNQLSNPNYFGEFALFETLYNQLSNPNSFGELPFYRPTLDQQAMEWREDWKKQMFKTFFYKRMKSDGKKEKGNITVKSFRVDLL